MVFAGDSPATWSIYVRSRVLASGRRVIRKRNRHPKVPGARSTLTASCASRRAAGRNRALLDVRQDAVELVEAVVTHHQLPLAAGRMLDGYLRTKLVGELLLKALDVRVAAVLALGG